MPVRSTAEEAAQAWAQGLSTSTEKIRRGVQRVQRSPGEAAAAKADKWLSGVQNSVDKWRNNTRRVSVGEWQQATIDGVGRVAEGATRRQGKFAERIAPVLTHLAGVLNTVDNMPDTTLDQRIQKSVALQRGMAQYRSGRTGT